MWFQLKLNSSKKKITKNIFLKRKQKCYWYYSYYFLFPSKWFFAHKKNENEDLRIFLFRRWHLSPPWHPPKSRFCPLKISSQFYFPKKIIFSKRFLSIAGIFNIRIRPFQAGNSSPTSRILMYLPIYCLHAFKLK